MLTVLGLLKRGRTDFSAHVRERKKERKKKGEREREREREKPYHMLTLLPIWLFDVDLNKLLFQKDKENYKMRERRKEIESEKTRNREGKEMKTFLIDFLRLGYRNRSPYKYAQLRK